jgi:hypothetical protein
MQELSRTPAAVAVGDREDVSGRDADRDDVVL